MIAMIRLVRTYTRVPLVNAEGSLHKAEAGKAREELVAALAEIDDEIGLGFPGRPDA